jgi:hypothetical protein
VEGHPDDLETLRELHRDGVLLVAQAAGQGYYIESPELSDPTTSAGQEAATRLIKRINGVGRATSPGFEPVRLTGRYTGPDGGAVVVVAAATVTARASLKATAVVLDSNGVPLPPAAEGPPLRAGRNPRFPCGCCSSDPIPRVGR